MTTNNNETKENSIRQFFKNKKKIRDIFIKLFIVILIGGYFVFFTSKSWLPSSGDLTKPTEINKTITANDREIKLMRWDYSEEQNLMEIEIDVINTSLDGVDTYAFSAIERTKGNLEVTTVVADSSFIVVQISNVPDDWQEISLRMNLPDEFRTTNTTTIKMYTNVDDVNLVSSITTLDLNGYKVARLENNIKIYQNSIDDLNKQISDIEKSINTYYANINTLQEQEQYQTEKEIEDTNKLIDAAYSKIDNSNTEIASLTDDLNEYQAKILKAQEQIAAIKQ